MTLSDQQLEEEYNFGLRVPHRLEFFDEWAAKSVEANSRMTRIVDVSYGSDLRHKVDFFPAVDPNAPLLMFIHGGYWQAQIKDNFTFIAEEYVKAGIAVAMLTYRLCPDVRVMDCIKDAMLCMKKLPSLLKSEGMTPSSYTLSGHSAGGNMTAWILGEALQENSILPKMTTAIGLSGIYEAWHLVPTTINEKLGMDEAEARACSPAVQDWNWSQANVILTSGSDESPDLLRQQGDLVTLINKAGGRAIECNAVGRHHFDVLYDFCDPNHELFQKSVALIKNA